MLPLAELLLTLSPASLKALVAALGPIPGLGANASPSAVARALHAYPSSYPASQPAHGTPRLRPALAAFALSRLPRFGTDGGRAAFVEAGRALGDRRAEGWLTLPAADVVVQLALEEATGKGDVKKRAKQLFARAGLRIDRDLPERPTYEMWTQTPGARTIGSVTAALRAAFKERLVHVWPAVDADGTLRLALFLRAPVKRILQLDPSSSDGFSAGPSLQVTVDELRIDPEGRRVAMMVALPDRLQIYARALDLSLRPSFTLRPFQLTTAAALKTLTGTLAMDVVGARVRRGDFREEMRGPHILDEVKKAGGGYFDRLTGRMAVEGNRKVDAFLQLPHRLDISDRSHAVPVRAALAAVGTFSPGALPDDARSLAPYEHGEWRWREVLGDPPFEQMRKDGLFTRVELAHVATREYRMHGAAYVVRDVPGEPGKQYALAEDRSLGAREVSADDRVAWRLDVEKLRQRMIRDLASSPVSGSLGIAGVLDLGTVALGTTRHRFVYAMAEPPAGWLDALTRACGELNAVILVPRGHAKEMPGMRLIELDPEEQLGARKIEQVLGRAAEMMGVRTAVETWRLWEEDLVVDGASSRMWLRGTLLTLSDNPRRFLEFLARHAGRTSPTKEIGKHVSSASSYPDVVARRTRSDVERQVRDCLRQSWGGRVARRAVDRVGRAKGVSAGGDGPGGVGTNFRVRRGADVQPTKLKKSLRIRPGLMRR